ncbi:S-adenosyl-L-methionine-dependent methyltransferase [Daldinia loculata]|nr:S-adenosyl-L-methionine-dependent methyltransferase [Daldinia loculata]
MSFFTTGPGYSLHHLTDNFAWNSLGFGIVVDVGGSHGDMAFALTRKYPDLNLIVQEIPEFMAHDFFEQPIKNVDAYLYRWILHNWPDKYCIRILKALIPALKLGSRVSVMDFVMPPPAMDLRMLEIGNAKERDLEWKSLFEQADSRFVFKGIQQLQGSSLAILEITWELKWFKRARDIMIA